MDAPEPATKRPREPRWKHIPTYREPGQEDTDACVRALLRVLRAGWEQAEAEPQTVSVASTAAA